MMEEYWKPIIGYEGYLISNKGRVKTLDRYVPHKRHGRMFVEGVLIKQYKDLENYYHVGLWKNNKSTTSKIHRLVGIHFIPNQENKSQINHKNGIKTDNRVENLEWATNQENRNHAVKNKLHAYGINNGMTRLSEKQVISIYQECNNYEMIARKYNVGISQVSRIKNGRQWKHLTNNIVENKFDRRLKINKEIANQIRKDYINGLSIRYLSEKYDLHLTTIYRIVNNKTWR